MILKIKYTKDHGTRSERVVFSATHDGDIGMHFVLNTKLVGNAEVSNQVTNPFWFPDTLVKAGDLIILYTKQGKPGFRTNTSGTTSHFFYRNNEVPLYTGNVRPLLLEAEEWEVEDK